MPTLLVMHFFITFSHLFSATQQHEIPKIHIFTSTKYTKNELANMEKLWTNIIFNELGQYYQRFVTDFIYVKCPFHIFLTELETRKYLSRKKWKWHTLKLPDGLKKLNCSEKIEFFSIWKWIGIEAENDKKKSIGNYWFGSNVDQTWTISFFLVWTPKINWKSLDSFEELSGAAYSKSVSVSGASHLHSCVHICNCQC